jgi:hypothetical protein
MCEQCQQLQAALDVIDGLQEEQTATMDRIESRLRTLQTALQEREGRIAVLEAALRGILDCCLPGGQDMARTLSRREAIRDAEAALSAPPSPLLDVVRAAVAWRLAQAFSGYEPQPITRLVDTVDDMMRQQLGVWE